MDKFTPDILILGYSGNKTEVRMFSLTGLSPSLVGRSRAVLLTFGFVTSFKLLILQAKCVVSKIQVSRPYYPVLLTIACLKNGLGLVLYSTDFLKL